MKNLILTLVLGWSAQAQAASLPPSPEKVPQAFLCQIEDMQQEGEDKKVEDSDFAIDLEKTETGYYQGGAKVEGASGQEIEVFALVVDRGDKNLIKMDALISASNDEASVASVDNFNDPRTRSLKISINEKEAILCELVEKADESGPY